MNQLRSQNNKLKDEIKKFVIKWNNEFPIDRWWREKHGIAFGSEAHKKANFIQMFLEYEEDSLMKEFNKSTAKETSEFISHDGEPVTEEQIDTDFENLNVEDYA